MKSAIKESKIRKARQDIAEVLNRYRVSLPEVIGVDQPKNDSDEEVWKSVQKDYEKIQQEMFAEKYPDLFRRIKKK